MNESILTYEKLGKALAGKGFNFVKFELEADVKTRGGRCELCEGRGDIPCPECRDIPERCDRCAEGMMHVVAIGDRLRVVTEPSSESTEIMCPFCDGHGSTMCNECGGRREIRCRNCAGGTVHPGEVSCGVFQQHHRREMGDLAAELDYYRCYHDGSVSTEVTFTIAATKLHLVPLVIEAFHRAASSLSGTENYSIANAGMHITIMEESRYDNPKSLPSRKIRNFRDQMDRIVCGLFLLGSSDDLKTRSSYFRQGRVSDYEKYSAIYTHGDTCIEYRVFDPCYRKPERVRQFLSVIVKTLKFYSDVPKMLPATACKMRQPSIRERTRVGVSKAFGTMAAMDSLFLSLGHIYPDSKKLQAVKKSYEEKRIKAGACAAILANV